MKEKNNFFKYFGKFFFVEYKLLKKQMNKLKKISFYISLILVFTSFYSCNQLDEVGYSLLPDEDKLQVFETDTLNILLKNQLSPDSLNSYRVSKAILGSYKDPIFGETKAEFVSELLPAAAYYLDHTSMTVDSVFLYLAYNDTLNENTAYGDLSVPINFSIHMLNKELDSTTYASNYDMTGNYEQDAIYQGSFKINAEDTILKIQLPLSLGQKIMNIDTIEGIANFKKTIPGLYFKIDGSSNNSMCIFNISSSYSRINMHYSVNDTTQKTATFKMYSDFTTNFNLFQHNYSGTEIENSILSNALEDSSLYIQSMNGSRTVIEINNLDSLKGKIINQAEIFFPIDMNSGYNVYHPVQNLLLLVENSDGNLEYMSEDNGIGANYDTTNIGYNFNITRYFQSLANQADSITSRLYLVPSKNKVDFRRVVIDNNNNKVKIKIKYTE